MYETEFASVGTGALALASAAYAPLWQVAIALGVIVAAALAVRLSGRLRQTKK